MAGLALSALLASGLAAPSARAGSYTDTQSGGTAPATVTPAADASFSNPQDAIAYASVSPRSGDGNPTYTIQIKPGTLTDTFTWTHGKNPDGTAQTDATDPPPACVLVEQSSSALWYVRNEWGTGTGSGQADCGLLGGTVTSGTYNAPLPSLSLGAVLWSVQSSPGASFSVSCSPTASFTGVTGTEGNVEGEARVGGGASVYPITLDLGGTLKDANGQPVLDGSGNQQALTGQQITAMLNGIPSNVKVTSYTWQPGANLIKNWDGTNNAQQLFRLLPADLTATNTTGSGIAVKSLAFYDQTKDVTSVSCTVNLKYPDGTTGSLTATSSKVSFVKPTATSTAYTSGPFVNTSGGYGATEYWNPATITVPSPFSTTGGLGCFVQLITPSRQATRTFAPGTPLVYATTYSAKIPDGSSGWKLPSSGLDTDFPYPYGTTVSSGAQVTSKYTWDVISQGKSGDMPSAPYYPPAIPGDMGGTNWYTATMKDAFTTWVMYKPASGIWVPLQSFSWSTNITVSNTSGAWAVSPGSAVTTEAGGTDTLNPPAWSNVNVASQTQMRP